MTATDNQMMQPAPPADAAKDPQAEQPEGSAAGSAQIQAESQPEEPGSTALQLPCTGIVWDIPRLCRRYRFLRSMREDVYFLRICYPYWLLSLTASVTWPVLGRRDTEQLRIVDALTGKSQKILSMPEKVVEQVVPDCTREDLSRPFPPRKPEVCGIESCPVHVVQPVLSEEEACAAATRDGMKELQKFYNRPLGIRADIRAQTAGAELLWKPFWVMRSPSHAERVFVFDATTGTGGTSGFWNVISYLFDL